MHSRIFCVGICIFGLLLKIRERFSLLRAENEEAGRTISLHKCQMEKMPAQRAQGGMGLEQAIIDIRNMYKIYNPGENEVRALDGVSLAVYKGEFVAIVGHSGSGKSTLMNMIGCLDTPTSGTYFLNGQDVSALSDNALSAIRNEQIGFIFQSFNLIKNLNALENVELPLMTISLHKCQMEKMPAQRAQGGMGLEQAIIDIRNMYKIYNPGENEVRALDGVSLAVYKGEFVAIVGHSGSGKSTLMNMIGCLDTPTSGTYFLNGQDVSALSDNALSAIRNEQIGFIFQSFNLIKNLNALENVELPLIYRGLPAGKRRLLALEALERVGLASRMDHRPNQMSGGQQQRVAVARAIAAHPPLILADEPTGNLDTRAGARVFEIIRALHAEGNTIVLITHDEGLARKAQRIVRITDGKIDDGEREVF